MPDPLVVRLMRDFKAALLAQESTQTAEMTFRWLQMERELQAEFFALATEVLEANASGQAVTASQLYKMNRYKSLLAQVDQQLVKYGRFAEKSIASQQAEFMSMAVEHSAQAIQATYANFGQIAGTFDRLPVSALEFMVGNAGDGAPLGKLLAESYPDAVGGITKELLKSLTLGYNPTKTAQAMADGFGVGLDRALTIARTEQLRVYRESSRLTYQNSGVARGYQRISARDTNVCAACLFADDGKVYDLDAPFEEHPNGRCTPAPVLIGMPAVEWQSGIQWFVAQNEDDQKSILGAGKFEAWQNGAFNLSDVIGRRESAEWGASLIPVPLKDLVK